MTVDLDRPPARLGPRFPLWIELLVIWATMIVLYAVIFAVITTGPDHGPNPALASGLVLILLSVAIVASVVKVYARLRTVTDGSLLAQGLAARGVAIGDPSDSTRVSDPEERQARRRLRKGAITRREYEVIIARRRFAHGEITHTEYEAIVHQMNETYADEWRGARAPPGPA